MLVRYRNLFQYMNKIVHLRSDNFNAFQIFKFKCAPAYSKFFISSPDLLRTPKNAFYPILLYISKFRQLKTTSSPSGGGRFLKCCLVDGATWQAVVLFDRAYRAGDQWDSLELSRPSQNRPYCTVVKLQKISASSVFNQTLCNLDSKYLYLCSTGAILLSSISNFSTRGGIIKVSKGSPTECISWEICE